jgi:hypothetical protein
MTLIDDRLLVCQQEGHVRVVSSTMASCDYEFYGQRAIGISNEDSTQSVTTDHGHSQGNDGSHEQLICSSTASIDPGL